MLAPRDPSCSHPAPTLIHRVVPSSHVGSLSRAHTRLSHEAATRRRGVPSSWGGLGAVPVAGATALPVPWAFFMARRGDARAAPLRSGAARGLIKLIEIV